MSVQSTSRPVSPATIVSEATHTAHELSKEKEQDPSDFEVKFDENDPENPQNISRLRKWYLTLASGLLVLNATFASSAPSGVLMQMIEEFKFSREVGTLTIALFVAGYVVGPLVWGPLSEQIGRRWTFIIAFIVYTAFQVGSALAQNTGQVLVFRFLGGCFAASPLTNSGGVIADMWDAKTRGKALALFTIMPFAGPTLGPVCAGYMSDAGVSWRWVFWLLTCFAGFCLALVVFTFPETYAPVVLVNKAKRIRKETGDNRYYAPLEKVKLGFGKQIERILARPFKMLFQEPMLLSVTVYMSFVYGNLYLLFEAFPIVFTQGHHLKLGPSGLMFLPIMLGGIVAVTVYILFVNPDYEKQVDKHFPNPVPAEYRLRPALVAAPLYAISFFWFAWTSYPSVSLWAPLMSGAVMGFAINWIFLSLFNYMIDTYLMFAASALAANTVVRSAFGAGFPLFATQMYEKLNPQWASTLLGCLAVLMIPIPFIFVKYGHLLREKSKFAPSKPLAAKPTVSDSSAA